MRDLTVCEIESVSGGSLVAAALTGIGAVVGGAIGVVAGTATAIMTGAFGYMGFVPLGIAVGGVAGLALGTIIGVVL